ncbi:microtubule-associated protein RP/EB family member 2-like [Drosophila tropicalis]|uniref:microtubule-associated protein RP/EB family member 2-like n=1 Tax=Drosophila tropicalis TaxID=46794 RepID=UPI0035ABF14A
MRNGAAYCQLMDMMFPQAMITLRDVFFSTTCASECRHNYRIVVKALEKVGLKKPLPVHELVRGNRAENLRVLRWFKAIYDLNYKGREYNVLKERNGCRMGYIHPDEIEPEDQIMWQVPESKIISITDVLHDSKSLTRAQKIQFFKAKSQKAREEKTKMQETRDYYIRKLKHVEEICDKYKLPSQHRELMNAIKKSLVEVVMSSSPVAPKQ